MSSQILKKLTYKLKTPLTATVGLYYINFDVRSLVLSCYDFLTIKTDTTLRDDEIVECLLKLKVPFKLARNAQVHFYFVLLRVLVHECVCLFFKVTLNMPRQPGSLISKCFRFPPEQTAPCTVPNNTPCQCVPQRISYHSTLQHSWLYAFVIMLF